MCSAPTGLGLVATELCNSNSVNVTVGIPTLFLSYWPSWIVGKMVIKDQCT